MLVSCLNQPLLRRLSVDSTSCGRFKHFNYKHCGRCVPCQIRRAAFLRWGQPDSTSYVFELLAKDDDEHSGFDDVRCAAMAIADAKARGLKRWMGNALHGVGPMKLTELTGVVERGLAELAALHASLRSR